MKFNSLDITHSNSELNTSKFSKNNNGSHMKNV